MPSRWHITVGGDLEHLADWGELSGILLCVKFISLIFCFCSVTQLCMTLCNMMACCMLEACCFRSVTVSWSLLKLMSVELMMPSNHLILYHPSLLLLPSIISSIRVFSNGMALCIRWPKYWSFSLSISSSNEYSELISFRIDWFDLLGIQGSGCNVKLRDQERPTEKVIDKQRAGGAQKSLWNSRREVFL